MAYHTISLKTDETSRGDKPSRIENRLKIEHSFWINSSGGALINILNVFVDGT